VVSESLSNVRSYNIDLDEDVENLRSGVCNTPIPYWEDEEKKKKKKSLYKVSGL
jgi:hypothetical protein